MLGFAVLALGMVIGAPIAFSLYSAHTAPKVVWVTPQPLQDTAVSQAPGETLSYFGYTFEVPWKDLDPAQTKLFPPEKPNRVVLTFRSGLRLRVTKVAGGEWMHTFSTSYKVTPKEVAAAYGDEAARSDYGFIKMLYEFTPDKMDVWTLSSRIHFRENVLLLMKSIAMTRAAESGIFAIGNQNSPGFQEGNPRARPDRLMFTLYSDSDSMEFLLSQKSYQRSAGVSQSDINRIIQSLKSVAPGDARQLTSVKDN